MEYINLHVSVIDSAEFKGATPDQQGTFLCVLRYACGQENGDTIPGCQQWTDRQWQTVVGAEKSILLQSCGLWEWAGEDLVINFYPIEQEKITRAKRRGGRLGNRRRWGDKRHTESHSDVTSESHSESITERNGTERNETKGVAPHFPEVEVPSEEEFVKACELSGIPAWYAQREHAWRSERPADRWPRGANWRTAVTSTFNRWRGDGAPMEAVQKNGAKKKPGVWELQQRLESLRKKAQQHPVNESANSYTEEDAADYEKLLAEIRQIEQAVAAAK